MTVIVPAYNVEAYLQDCVGSILEQTYRNIEVILVDDGSTDGTLAIAGSFANSDRRVQVITQPNQGPAAARNLGASLAKGEFLTFVDSDDELPPEAIDKMVQASLVSGSEMIIGKISRTRGNSTFIPQWAEVLHHETKLGTTVNKYPQILRNFYTGSKMYRRSFWEKEDFRYREGTIFEDQPLITEAMFKAATIDILSDITYNWRLRLDGTSRSQGMYTVEHIEHRIEATSLTQAVVEQHGTEESYAHWLRTLTKAHFPGYLKQSLRESDEVYAAVVRMIKTFIEVDDLLQMPDVEVTNRLLLYLALTKDKSTVDDFLLNRGFALSSYKASIEEGAVYVAPLIPALDSAPKSLLRVSEDELSLSATLKTVVWKSSTELELTGWASIAALTSGESIPLHEISVTIDNGVTRLDLANEIRATQAPLNESGAFFGGQQGARFQVSFNVGSFLKEARLNSIGNVYKFPITVNVSVSGLTRQGALTKRVPNSSARTLRTRHIGEGVFARPVWNGAEGLVLELSRWPFRVAQVRRLNGGLLATIEQSVEGFKPVRAEGQFKAEEPIEVALMSRESGGLEVFLEDSRFPKGLTRLRLVSDDGREQLVRISHAELGDSPRGVKGLYPRVLGGNRFACSIYSPTAVIDTYELGEDGCLIISGRVNGVTPTLECRVVAPWARSFPAYSEVSRGRFEFELDLRHSTWSQVVPALPVGHYRLVIKQVQPDGTRDQLSVALRDDLVDQMPIDLMTDVAFCRLYKEPRGQVKMEILTPIGHMERSQYGMAIKRDQYIANSDQSVIDAVYYQCLDGEGCSDSQLEVFKWFRHNRPDIPQYWGIASWSVPVPAGGIGVLIDSQEWFDVLGKSRFICVNHELPQFFKRRPKQVVVQTYHGHPFKAMGTHRWRALGLGSKEVAINLDRRSSWDILLAPSPVATELYKKNFPLDYILAEVGHPRNDPLVSEHDQLRESARKQLGIRPEAKVVLWAPTYRDYVGTPWVSELTNVLDPHELADLLGPEYVVLVRGHASNLRYATKSGKPLIKGTSRSVIDVSDYPHINHLIAASDCAVLDYSSLRFDYSVTKKPMYFFVPDKDQYFELFPPLFAYEESVPGPLIADIGNLVRHIRDPNTYWTRYAHQYETFRKTFNPLEDGLAASRLAVMMLDQANKRVLAAPGRSKP